MTGVRCPECYSEKVFRSQSTDKSWLRVVLCSRMRCHWCGLTFVTPPWQTAGREVEPRMVQLRRAVSRLALLQERLEETRPELVTLFTEM